MRTCPYCATQNPDGLITCPNCGEALDSGAATTTEMPAAPFAAGQPAYPATTAPIYAPGPPPAAAPPGPGWWMASDGRWYPPQAPPPMVVPTPGWVQGANGQWYQAPVAQPYGMYPTYYDPPKTKVVAALLAFFVGSTGAHNFYLGRTSIAVTQLCMLIAGFVLSLVIVGIFVLMALSIWVFVEFIMILTGGIRDGQNRPLV